MPFIIFQEFFTPLPQSVYQGLDPDLRDRLPYLFEYLRELNPGFWSLNMDVNLRLMVNALFECSLAAGNVD